MSKRRYSRYARYPQRLASYALQYRRSIPVLKKWIATGKRAVELPPLHHPEKMPAWWTKHMNSAVPIEILECAETTKRDFSGEVPSPEKSLVVCEPLPPSVIPSASAEPGSPERDVEQLTHHLRLAEARLQSAIASKDSAAIAVAERSYGAFAEVWRKSQDSLAVWRKDRGDMIPRAQVAAELGGLIEQLVDLRHGMSDAISTLVENGTPLREAIETVRQNEDRLLQSFRFAE